MASPSAERAASLRGELASLGLSDDEVEIELEMLAGLEHLASLQSRLTAGQLPQLETGHRVVGTDQCHFSAPVSMPEEQSQPSGRLLLTSARAIFTGGGTSTTISWHAVSDVLQQDRDVILIRRDREMLYRFRCNVFGDALEAAWIARTLSSRPRRRHGA